MRRTDKISKTALLAALLAAILLFALTPIPLDVAESADSCSITFNPQSGEAVLGWEYPRHADSFAVYINGKYAASAVRESVAVTGSVEFAGEYSFAVVPVIEGKEITADSMFCTYRHFTSLKSPNNILFYDNTLTWDRVYGARYYTVDINGVRVYRGADAQADIGEYIADGKSYDMVVSARDDSELCNDDGAFSSLLFSASASAAQPENLYIVFDGSSYFACWYCPSYTLFEFTLLSDGKTVCSLKTADSRIDISDFLTDGAFTAQVKAVSEDTTSRTLTADFSINGGIITVSREAGV